MEARGASRAVQGLLAVWKPEAQAEWKAGHSAENVASSRLLDSRTDTVRTVCIDAPIV